MSAQHDDKFAGARENAKGWFASIEEMLEAQYIAAANDAGWSEFKDQYGARCWRDSDDGQTWAGSPQELCEEFGLEPTDQQRESAEQTIHESVLSVLVRDGWHEPGQLPDDGAEEYEILLSTGGPALRIYGKLGRYNEPESAELQMQDWFLPWTRYDLDEVGEAKLLQFVQQFYFGE